MAPRLSTSQAPLAAALDALVLSSTTTTTAQRAAGAAAVSISSCRAFSTTQRREKTSRARRDMYTWLASRRGRELEHHTSYGPKYLGGSTDQPFPLNPLFRSDPVLDEESREAIWQRAMEKGHALKEIAYDVGADVRRIAAIIRLKQVEKNMVNDGQPLATPYAKAVMSMLPKKEYRPGQKNTPLEAVNEVHVHKHTMQQLFVPVSESRHFTRKDAAAAFHPKMLSVDERSPAKEVIQIARDQKKGKSSQEAVQAFRDNVQEKEVRLAEKHAREEAEEEARTKRVDTGRYEFRIREMDADNVGTDGKARKAKGWRYGAPHNDRKRGMVKIPTSVP